MLPFIALKALSFLPGGALLKNPKVIIGAIIVALLVFGYLKWKSSIKQAIFNQIYTEQAEQHIENQRREMERTQQLFTESNRAVREAQEKRAKLMSEIEAARSRTRNVAEGDNGAVAPVLQDALEFIRARQGHSTPPPPTLTERMTSAVTDVLKGSEKAPENIQPPAIDTGNSAIDAWRAKQKAKK